MKVVKTREVTVRRKGVQWERSWEAGPAPEDDGCLLLGVEEEPMRIGHDSGMLGYGVPCAGTRRRTEKKSECGVAVSRFECPSPAMG